MKRYFLLSWDIESTPGHLAMSVILAAYAMLMVNGFLGSMGGVPVFLGFLFAYYLLRGIVLSGNRLGHMLAMDSREEVRRLFATYGIIFLVIWLAFKGLYLVSKFSGWGSVDGVTIGEYFNKLYGTTLLERWAYFFVAALMFMFIMSLFPLVVIRSRKNWALYFLADSFVFALTSLAISLISRHMTKKALRGRATCVLDNLLLSNLPYRWQAGLYLGIVLVLALLLLVLVYKIALWTYMPKPGRHLEDRSRFFQPGSKVEDGKGKRQILPWLLGGSFGLAILVVLGLFLFTNDADQLDYHKVAECMTEDFQMGPMVYGGTVYLPVDKELDYVEKGLAMGYLGLKDQACDSRFYELTEGNVLYRAPDWSMTYLQVLGAEENSYELIERLEKETDLSQDQVFLLWDEDWEAESAYSDENTGYRTLETSLVTSLEETYGVVTYHPSDFSDYDACFTIRGYGQLKDALDEEIPYGDWVGLILVKDDRFYYGNYDNEITGDTLSQLRQALGGNETSTEVNTIEQEDLERQEDKAK